MELVLLGILTLLYSFLMEAGQSFIIILLKKLN